jgi:hypothetical protein
MARGFESKSVADQQEESQRERPEREGAEARDSARLAKRRTLELARADVLKKLETVTADAHKEMLKRALAAVDKDLAAL